MRLFEMAAPRPAFGPDLITVAYLKFVLHADVISVSGRLSTLKTATRIWKDLKHLFLSFQHTCYSQARHTP